VKKPIQTLAPAPRFLDAAPRTVALAPLDADALTPARGLGADPVTVYLSSYTSENSRIAMASSLAIAATLLTGERVRDPRTVPWHELRFEHVSALKAKLARRYASTSANRHLLAVRGLIKVLWRMGLMDRDTCDRIVDVPMLKASRPEAGRALSDAEIASLFEACSKGQTPEAAIRDAAILTVMLSAGLRRAEACSLDVASFERLSGVLTIHGKGDKYRTVQLGPKGRSKVEAWLAARGAAAGPLFCPMNVAGKPQPSKRLAHQGLAKVLDTLCKRAGLAHFTPHDLRRTFITRLLDKGADPLVVSKLAGHANLETTRVYDKRGERAKAAAVLLIDD